MGLSRSTKILLLILGAALGLRLAWVLTRSASLEGLPDQLEYLALAENWLRGEGMKFYDARFHDVVWAYRTPGYPLFVAALGAKIEAVRVGQAVLDTLTVLGVYLLGRRWLEERWALVGAAMAGLNPFLIFFTGLILSETLFTALLVWGMVLLVGGRRPNLRLALGGLVLALSVLVRPGAVGLPVVLGIASLFANRATEGAYHFKFKLPPVATTLGLMLLVLFPWAMRNRVATGHWVWLTTNGGVTQYDGFNPDADGSSDQAFLKRMPQLESMTEVERDEYLSGKATEWTRENPGRAVELAVRKIGRTWSPVPLSQDYRTKRNVAVGLIYTVPLDVLVVLGLVYGRLRRSEKFFLFLPAIYFTVVHALSVGSLRYRVPVEPVLTVLAAAGVSYVVSSLKEKADVAVRE